MKKPEQLVWAALSNRMSGLWVAQRHEDRYSDGIPDVSFVYSGCSGWLELKAAEGDRLIVVRPSQLSWMRARAFSGALCCIVARRGPDWGVCRVSGLSVDHIYSSGLRFRDFSVLGLVGNNPADLLFDVVTEFMSNVQRSQRRLSGCSFVGAECVESASPDS